MLGINLRAALSATILLVSASFPASAAETDPSSFISELGNHGIQILQAGPDLAKRKVEFSKIFTEDFDVPAIGKFVLGQYWRTSTPEQQQAYLSAFGQYIVSIYAERFSNYQGEKFTVTGAQQSDAATSVVHSQLLRTNGAPPVNIDWQVAKEGDAYKIVNVVVENLSMALTQRQEFASVIQRGGGNIDALITQLKQKNQAT